MKKKIAIFSLLLITLIGRNAFAQEKKEWKEMKNFHAVISKTFHPSEENNLQPLKDSAEALEARAIDWEKSKVPLGYNADVTTPILKSLVKKCTDIKAAVRFKKSDKDLKKLITEAHEIFHEIMEKCRKEEHHD